MSDGFAALVFCLSGLLCVWVAWRLLILLSWLIVAFLCFSHDRLWVLLAWPFALGAPVPMVPDWVRTDGSRQPLGESAGVAETRRVPVTAHLCARPRRRAIWVRKMEAVLGPVPVTVGEVVRGRWLPDLPSVEFSAGLNLVLSQMDDGVRIRGGGSVQGKPKEGDLGGFEKVPYFVCELRDGSLETVFPDLLAALSSYAFLRKRDATLLLALRSRAVEWCKRSGLDQPSGLVAVSFTTRWAWSISAAEFRARAGMEEEPLAPWWG
jgi:hypothetical protein